MNSNERSEATIELRSVTTGGKSGSDTIIRGGLQPGERVATDAFDKLGDGVKVDPAP